MVEPTAEPTEAPATVPTTEPTAEPAAVPTTAPTAAPVVPETPVQPAEDDATDEPVYEPIPEGETIHGVPVNDEVRMGIAMTKVAQDIGEDAEVELVGVEVILTAEEYQTFQTLPLIERMLVLLRAIGYEDEVTNALAEMELTLSEEAQALLVRILERLAAMPEDERAAFEALLTETFTKTDDQVELTIVIDGERYELYDFQELDSIWFFVQAAIAQA